MLRVSFAWFSCLFGLVYLLLARCVGWWLASCGVVLCITGDVAFVLPVLLLLGVLCLRVVVLFILFTAC